MAPVKSRIEEYVQQKNASASDKAAKMSLEAMKVQVPSLGSHAYISRSRSRDSKTKREEYHMPLSINRATQGSEPKFYDTEASNIEDSSTNTHSALEKRPPSNADVVHGFDTIPSKDSSSSDDDESSQDELSEGLVKPSHHRGTNRYNGKLNPSLMRKLQAFRQSETPFHIDGNRLGHLDGDTYPSQTSGPPSKLSNPVSATEPDDSRGSGAQDLGAIGFGSRQPLGGTNFAQNYRQPSRSGQDFPAASQLIMPATSQFQNLGSPKPLQGSAQARLDEASYPRFDLRHRTLPHQHDPRQMIVNQRNGLRPSKVDGAALIEREDEQQSVTVKHYEEPDVAGSPKAIPRDVEHQLQSAQFASPEHVTLHQHNAQKSVISQFRGEEGIDERQMPESNEDESAQLDYGLPELYGMQYAEIKGQDFDVDPSGHNIPTMEPTPGICLADRMDALFKSSPSQQALFFDSLKIDEWEEAGDWFLDRFGDLVRDFRVARQKKRKAARSMEDEIEQRHEEVVKKKQTIELTLDSIRATGATILSGTPQTPKHARLRRE
nr:hypothetical protein CFP56_67568 [Quercus suber]